MLLRILFLTLLTAMTIFSQTPPIENGVSQTLARWRAANYSDVRYKLNLRLEKGAPTLKGTIEISVKMKAESGKSQNDSQIILDWRKIRGYENLSTVANASVNGQTAKFEEINEHLVFKEGVKQGENKIKLDFTSPILTSGSAITRYVDKEDGAEYIYSLFVPSDASTAFPVFDQPDLKARFTLTLFSPQNWKVVANTSYDIFFPKLENDSTKSFISQMNNVHQFQETKPISTYVFAFAAGEFAEVSEPPASAGVAEKSVTPVSAGVAEKSVTPVSAGVLTSVKNNLKRNSNPEVVTPANAGVTDNVFAEVTPVSAGVLTSVKNNLNRNSNLEVATPANAGVTDNGDLPMKIYVRKSQAEKFKQHAAEVFRLNRECVKYLESYFDYKFPFPKYDLVLIPEFPFGGMEHAGATFLREDRIIFPTEPTKNDYVTRANLIFHEAAHQWFGDTVTMKWFDDLWLKEGFAEFMAYKTLEKVMPEYNAWKIFYERNKQAAYLTDSTKGTTPIYQEIPNLSSAKSAYGNIVYRKAPSFLKQAEFYLGADKFQTAVRAFLKKHEFANADWQDLVNEFETASKKELKDWANVWVKERGTPLFRTSEMPPYKTIWGKRRSTGDYFITQKPSLENSTFWKQKTTALIIYEDGSRQVKDLSISRTFEGVRLLDGKKIQISDGKVVQIIEVKQNLKNLVGLINKASFVFPNYQDYGYGIFLLDEKSRAYVLANIQNEKDDFLRAMMWGSLWDSVREAELDPKDYVELVIKNINIETDESTIQTLLGRVSTAINYYLSEPSASADGKNSLIKNSNKNGSSSNAEILPPADAGGSDLSRRLENLLIEKMKTAPTIGQKITYYRAFLSLASSENARNFLKDLLNPKNKDQRPFEFKTKDKFDIVTRLLILNDKDAASILSELEKTETSEEAKRYGYAARAGIATAENKAKYWSDFVGNKEISENWIEAAFATFNTSRHSSLTLPYLEKALAELPNLKRNRKIFFVNGWLGAFVGGQKSAEALAIINKFLGDNPNLDKDLRLKILENADIIERSVKIRVKYNN